MLNETSTTVLAIAAQDQAQEDRVAGLNTRIYELSQELGFAREANRDEYQRGFQEARNHHIADMLHMSRGLVNVAENRDFCDEYEDWLDDMSNNLVVPFNECAWRIIDRDVEVTCSRVVSVEVRRGHNNDDNISKGELKDECGLDWSVWDLEDWRFV